MFENAMEWIVQVVEAMGYFGVFLMAALESTFLPIPSEATLIPAGYLIHQGKWNGPAVFALAVTGTITGSLANYWVARSCGRYVLIRYSKYFFITPEKLAKVEDYFQRHGPVSIFLGRLVFGVRHFISFPAGLARMDLKKFCLYTTAGGGLWTMILLVLGYAIGNNQDAVTRLLPEIKIGFLVAVALAGFIYWRRITGKSRNKTSAVKP